MCCVLGVVLQTILDVYIYIYISCLKETVCKKCLMIPEWLPQAVIRGRTGQRKGPKKIKMKERTKQKQNKEQIKQWSTQYYI